MASMAELREKWTELRSCFALGGEKFPGLGCTMQRWRELECGVGGPPQPSQYAFAQARWADCRSLGDGILAVGLYDHGQWAPFQIRFFLTCLILPSWDLATAVRTIGSSSSQAGQLIQISPCEPIGVTPTTKEHWHHERQWLLAVCEILAISWSQNTSAAARDRAGRASPHATKTCRHEEASIPNIFAASVDAIDRILGVLPERSEGSKSSPSKLRNGASYEKAELRDGFNASATANAKQTTSSQALIGEAGAASIVQKDGPGEDNLFWWKGKPVKLQPLPWRLLKELYSREGRKCEEENLCEVVWADNDVTTVAIKSAIGKIRKAFEKKGVPLILRRKSGVVQLLKRKGRQKVAKKLR